MAVALRHRRFSPEEYLTLERAAEYKSEYLNGEIFAMAGGSPDHNTISYNLNGITHRQLIGGPCRGYTSDMKVRSTPEGLYSYPDLTIVCGEPRFHDKYGDVLLNPTAIFEVLSPGTESFDRGEKWAHYQTIESLRDYVMISQDEPQIQHYAKQPDGRWMLSTTSCLDNSIRIVSIECDVVLSEVYDRIEFQAGNL